MVGGDRHIVDRIVIGVVVVNIFVVGILFHRIVVPACLGEGDLLKGELTSTFHGDSFLLRHRGIVVLPIYLEDKLCVILRLT
jgi:hypothetical protein